MTEILRDSHGVIFRRWARLGLDCAVPDFIKRNKKEIMFPIIIITRKSKSFYIRKSLNESGGGFDVRDYTKDGIDALREVSGKSIIIINREAFIANGVAKALAACKIKSAIVDGANIIQNLKSKTYKAMLKVFGGNEKIIVFSNEIDPTGFWLDPIKVFSALKFIRAKFLKNKTWHDFSSEFCNKRRIGWRTIVDGFNKGKLEDLLNEIRPYIFEGCDAG